jgi:hypothetical protein
MAARRSWSRYAICCVGALLLVLACSDSTSSNSDNSGGKGSTQLVCEQADSRDCTCRARGGDDVDGTQVCNAVGSGFDPCFCKDLCNAGASILCICPDGTDGHNDCDARTGIYGKDCVCGSTSSAGGQGGAAGAEAAATEEGGAAQAGVGGIPG